MKKIITFCFLLASLAVQAQPGVDSLYKPQTIGLNARNQRIGNGLMIHDSLITNGIAIFNSNVGIGTATPTTKIEAHSGQTIMYFGDKIFAVQDTVSTSAITWFDSSGNHLTKVFGINNGFNYSSFDSTDISLGIGQREGGAHVAQIEFHSNKATGVGHVHIDVRDTSLNEIQLHVETIDSNVVLSTNGTGIAIEELAGSGTRIVTANSSGVIGTTTLIGGSNTQVQYNDNGSFAGDAGFVYDATNDKLTVDALEIFAPSTTVTAIGNGVSDTMTGAYNTVFGFQAGRLAASGAVRNTMIGGRAGHNLSTGDNNVFVGDDAGRSIITGADNIMIGSIIQGANVSDNIILANNFSVDTTYGNGGQFVVGSVQLPITKVYIGNNYTHTANVSSVTINVTGGSGTNDVGTHLILAGGISTGNASAGEIIFQTSSPGASSSTPQTLVECGKFDASTTVGNTRFFLYDVDNGTLERVTVGAADSGGSGFKVLRIPN